MRLHVLAAAVGPLSILMPSLAACGDDASTASTGGAGGEAGAGGAGVGGGIVDPEMTSPFTCVSGTEPFEALRVGLSLDSLEHREEAAVSGEVSALALVGTVCGTATDRDACFERVGEARSEESLFTICGNCFPSQRYLVATRGDAVEVVASREAMLAWLGPVDAPGKAWLVAMQADYRPACGDAWIRRDGADHLIVTRELVSDCPLQYDEVLVRVSPDGVIDEVERRSLPETGGCA